MKFSINLRSDLQKLSDAELSQRLQDQWRIYELAQIPHPKWYSLGLPLIFSWRGPIRHRRAYRFFNALGSTYDGRGSGWLDALFIAVASSKWAEKFLQRDPVSSAHLSMCEIRDIMDEAERRVGERRVSS